MFNIVNDQVTETRQLLSLMKKINREVNAFPYKKDKVIHDQVDYWSALIEKYRAGDCDDYALTKRKRLIDAGVPYQCLFPTVCKAQNEGHLVLIVRTNMHDWMLDNIEKDVVTVNQVNYRWLYRLDPLTHKWVKLFK